MHDIYKEELKYPKHAKRYIQNKKRFILNCQTIEGIWNFLVQYHDNGNTNQFEFNINKNRFWTTDAIAIVTFIK